jgi:hypothetical protein
MHPLTPLISVDNHNIPMKSTPLKLALLLPALIGLMNPGLLFGYTAPVAGITSAYGYNNMTGTEGYGYSVTDPVSNTVITSYTPILGNILNPPGYVFNSTPDGICYNISSLYSPPQNYLYSNATSLYYYGASTYDPTLGSWQIFGGFYALADSPFGGGGINSYYNATDGVIVESNAVYNGGALGYASQLSDQNPLISS